MKESVFKSYDELPLFLNAEMVAKLLGVSPSSAYELMHEKDFPSLRVGNRFVIPKEHFIDWVENEKVMAYIRYPSREAKRNYFPVPNCVMELKLPWKKLAVYLYLIHRYRYQYRTDFDYPRMLSESFGISKQTAKNHLDYLFDDGLIHTVGPMIFPKHYIGAYEDWPANFFPLPKEIFNLGLSMGEVVLYSYLMYREDRKSFLCLVSRSRLWEVMGMSTNTAAKYIRLLEEKRLIETEHTTCKRKNGEPLNGQLRFRVLPIEGAKIRLSELQMQQNSV